METKLSKRTVLITGASSGFGLRLAQAFHSRGWHVIAGLRDARTVPRELDGVTTMQIDLEDNDKIAAAVAGVERLDCLINNAGYALTGPFSSYEITQMRRQMQVNVLGPALLTQKLLPALKSCGGRIINISSLSGETGMPMNTIYCASKHAVEGFAESLRHELFPHGVQVALVEPGGFRTRFASNMEWGTQEETLDHIDAEQLAGYRAMREQMLEAKGRDPALVVSTVISLAEMKRMPIRTRVGADAHLLRGIKRWLPENWAMTVLGAAFRRRLSKKRWPNDRCARR